MTRYTLYRLTATLWEAPVFEGTYAECQREADKLKKQGHRVVIRYSRSDV